MVNADKRGCEEAAQKSQQLQMIIFRLEIKSRNKEKVVLLFLVFLSLVSLVSLCFSLPREAKSQRLITTSGDLSIFL